MLGQSISHYRIVSQLGVGGMGIVYEGVDPRLGRPVAIKFVPEELSHDLKALERLRSEARTASGLNHPNICTIYDVGEHDGRPFIVMELLKGQTLRDRIGSKPLKIHEAVDIGIQVADALDCAHERNVIHRDIKPANLFIVERGQVKILDFGLAKLLHADKGSQLTLAPTVDQTAAGIALGTVAYMSPEQVQGEELDRRTDLFSLGVVLYECVTGHQPFKGKTSAVVFASILTQAPTAPIALNPEVPARLQDVINNCLEKDRELRCQEAGSLRAELKRVKRDLESGAARVAVTGAVPLQVSVGGRSDVSGRATVSVPVVSGPVIADPSAAHGPAKSNTALWTGGTLAAVAVIAATAIYTTRDAAPGAPSPSPLAAVTAAPSPPAATPAAAPAAAAVPEPAPLPAVDAVAKARFDAAIAEANRMLGRGDLDAASNAMNRAREMDAASPEVGELSAKLMEAYRTDAEAARRAAADRARTAAAEAARNAQTARRVQADPSPAAPQPAPTPAPVAMPAAPPAVAVAPVALPPTPRAADPAPVPAPAPAPRVEPAPERRAAPPPAPVEDDDAAIRRVVASYARAIETKDIALFRAVKPNLTADEQRRLETGFRAVTSQRVSITVDAIERRGQDAVVRLRRHDIVQAGGRQQTADSQQTLTFTHAGGAWVIREIR